MALMTPEQFEESLKPLKPRVFMNGKLVENFLENKNTRTVVESNKASYAWALDPKYKDIMSCYSPLIDDVVNRYTHVSASIDDLVKKADAGTFTAEMLGTCIYRCVGYDAFHSLASTTWEMDRDLGTQYHPRFLEYLKINDQLMEMVVLRETGRACGLASARKGAEEPVGSGTYLPDELMSNVSKLNICNAFWRVMALAGDIGGGLIVTMPSLKELNNPEVKDYVEEFYSFGSDTSTKNILKAHKLLQHWTAGQHGVATWHGAGPVMANKIMLQRVIDYTHEKDIVKQTLKLEDT